MSDTNESFFVEAPTAEPELPLPGAALRAAREAHGYSLSDVSQALKFSVRQLDALENDDYNTLRGTTFIRGFVRSYARYLKLDETPLLLSLEPRAPVAVTDVKAVESMNAEMPEQDADMSSRRAYLLAAGVLLLGGLAWFAIQGHAPAKPSTEQIVAPAPATIIETAPASSAASSVAAPVTPSASAPAVPASASHAANATTAAVPVSTSAPTQAVASDGDRQLVLNFSAESWVEVRDAAQHVLFSGTNPAGSSQTLHGKPPFQLVVGNAPAVKLRYGDRNIDLQPYTRVDVARLTLDDNTK